MPNKIWHSGDINSANWFIRGVTQLGLTWEKAIIPEPGTAEFMNLPEQIKQILRLDKPDLIATLEIDGKDFPVLSIEITLTTPQSQHAKQRIPRLIAAAEAGVPAIYIILERKKSGDSIYSIGTDLFYCLDRIQQINRIPVLIYYYPDDSGNPMHDPHFPNQPDLSATSIINNFKSIKRIIKNKLAGLEVASLYNDTWISTELEKQKHVAEGIHLRISSYTTLKQINTSDLESFLARNTKMASDRIQQTVARLPDRIRIREKTLIFRPGGRLFEHANDPYSGMLAFFDYSFCRIGRRVEDRHKNLVYMPIKEDISKIVDEFCPDGYHRYWEHKCPFSKESLPSVKDQFEISHNLQYGCVYTKIKPLRILGYFSDMIIFQDSLLVF